MASSSTMAIRNAITLLPRRWRVKADAARHADAIAGILDTAPIRPVNDGVVLFSMIGTAVLLPYLVAVKSLWRELGRGRVAILDVGEPVARIVDAAADLKDLTTVVAHTGISPWFARDAHETLRIDADDWVAEEVPVALVFNGISHAVMMATPQDLAEFAIGFALSEGVVEHARECREVEVQQHGSGTPDESCAVHIDIPPRHFMRLKERRRALVGRTGCGVCGIDSLAALDLHPAPIAAAPWRAQLDAATVLRPFETLSQRQSLNARAGSLHAAGWATPEGVFTERQRFDGDRAAVRRATVAHALAGLLQRLS